MSHLLDLKSLLWFGVVIWVQVLKLSLQQILVQTKVPEQGRDSLLFSQLWSLVHGPLVTAL